MARPKIYKIAAGVLLVGIAAVSVIYLTLTNRHKAIVKTFVLHKLHLIDPDWNVRSGDSVYRMISPSFLIDGIYKSMEGPKDSRYVQLSQDSTLLWLTGFHVRALDAKTMRPVSNDFVCHTNVDFNDAKYYGNFHLEDRIGRQYPRMTSLSHGMEDFQFPKGYGVPMKGDDLLYVTTQTLNHNYPDTMLQVKHQVDIRYTRKSAGMKPLMARTAFIMLPYDKRDPYEEPTDPGSNQCIPVETKNHSYEDAQGHTFSGHWVVPVGKSVYRSNVDGQLNIADSLRLHAAAIHVHPFATSISLVDDTMGKPVFVSPIVNHKNRIGLDSIAPFSSEAGIWLYKNHHYDIVLTVDNTSKVKQDMMGSMFLFFYDRELDGILHQLSK